MHSSTDNFVITPFLRLFTIIESLVLIGAGGGLFFLPTLTSEQWPWALAPFNTRFLGAIYLSAMLSVAGMVWVGRWSPTRTVLRTIFAFTFVVLSVSVFYHNQFDFGRWGAWLWFGLYISLPTSAGYHLWIYRHMKTDHLPPIAPSWSLFLTIQSISLLIYGGGLLGAPHEFSQIFPWPLDAFHSRLYSAAFIAGGIDLWSIRRMGTRFEFLAAGATAGSLGLFAIWGLIIVDAHAKRIDWSASNTWLWLSIFSALSITGILLGWFGLKILPPENEG